MISIYKEPTTLDDLFTTTLRENFFEITCLKFDYNSFENIVKQTKGFPNCIYDTWEEGEFVLSCMNDLLLKNPFTIECASDPEGWLEPIKDQKIKLFNGFYLSLIDHPLCCLYKYNEYGYQSIFKKISMIDTHMYRFYFDYRCVFYPISQKYVFVPQPFEI